MLMNTDKSMMKTKYLALHQLLISIHRCSSVFPHFLFLAEE